MRFEACVLKRARVTVIDVQISLQRMPLVWAAGMYRLHGLRRAGMTIWQSGIRWLCAGVLTIPIW